MGPETELLCERLRDTSTLLRSAGESHWARWMETSLRRIEKGDFSGVEHLLSAFGGMGSFNDLILMSTNGHSVTGDNQRDFNDRLDDLRVQLYTIAQNVRRNALIGD